MLDGGLFDKLEQLARKVRRNDAPFGGLQLVLCGDFFQLPPVGLGERREGEVLRFLFHAKCWDSVVKNVVVLTDIFRQSEARGPSVHLTDSVVIRTHAPSAALARARSPDLPPYVATERHRRSTS